ncbi:hypothetical protein D3C76_1770480 [compost metagenome]
MVAHAADLDAKVFAVTGHHRHDGALLNLGPGIHGRLAIGHRQVEEELVGNAEELHDLGQLNVVPLKQADFRG